MEDLKQKHSGVKKMITNLIFIGENLTKSITLSFSFTINNGQLFGPHWANNRHVLKITSPNYDAENCEMAACTQRVILFHPPCPYIPACKWA